MGLTGEVEADEVYITAGCKGNNNSRPAERDPRCRGLKQKGRGTYESDKVPILGLVERGGDIHCSVVRNVQTRTVQPIMEQVISVGSTVYTDEYNIYNFLDRSEDYQRISVCHSKGEYAIDLDNDGVYEAHVNTQEGIWSVLRPWIEPHRGVNKMFLPLYVAQFEFFYCIKHLTPAQQIRKMIRYAASFTGWITKEGYKLKILNPMFSI